MERVNSFFSGLRLAPYILVLFLFVSCKAKKNIVQSSSGKFRTDTEIRILDSIYDTTLEYNSFETVADVEFAFDGNKQNVKAQVKILKDQFIWASINLVGIPFARAFITPTKVLFYERVNKTYLEEDINYLKESIGIEFSFSQLQRLLLGQPMLQPDRENYDIKELNQVIHLISLAKSTGKEIKGIDDLNQNLSFTRRNLSFFSQFFSTEDLTKKLEIRYDERDAKSRNVPAVIHYHFEDNKTIDIDIRYKRLKFDDEIIVKMVIPEGYTKINVK